MSAASRALQVLVINAFARVNASHSGVARNPDDGDTAPALALSNFYPSVVSSTQQLNFIMTLFAIYFAL